MTFVHPWFGLLLLLVYGSWLVCRKNYQARLLILLCGSIVFYGYRQWGLLLVLAAYCLADWAIGRWIQRSRSPRSVLAIGIAFNTLVLVSWKYAPILWETAARLAQTAGFPGQQTVPHWTFPMGISFYAFTGIAYMIDVYRGAARTEHDVMRFSLFLTFFPHLVAGPILRAQEFLPSLQPEHMPGRSAFAGEALFLTARGFFKKMVLADQIAQAIDPFFSHVGDLSTEGVWTLPYIYLYALQIYFDFSGYTDIARGLALLFGFRWPENFRLPYLAGSIRDFWRRWHITLAKFFRDYVYIPLGGNRGGPLQRYGALMATMLLCGLWHGSHWSFLLWGGMHGAYLAIHQRWRTSSVRNYLAGLTGIVGGLWRLFCVALTFQCVSLAWCFFRVTDFTKSLACLQTCFIFDSSKLFVGGSADLSLWALLTTYGILAWAAHRYEKAYPLIDIAQGYEGSPFARGVLWGGSIALLLLAVLLQPSSKTPPFIYFRF